VYFISDRAKYTKLVQYARSADMKIAGISTPKHFDTVRGLGVDEVYDFKDPEAPNKIKQLAGGELKYAVHAIPEFSSDFVFGVTSDGSKAAIVLPYGEEPRDGIEAIYSIGYGFSAEVSSRLVRLVGSRSLPPTRSAPAPTCRTSPTARSMLNLEMS
jgi:hypothetical protein